MIKGKRGQMVIWKSGMRKTVKKTGIIDELDNDEDELTVKTQN